MAHERRKEHLTYRAGYSLPDGLHTVIASRTVYRSYRSSGAVTTGGAERAHGSIGSTSCTSVRSLGAWHLKIHNQSLVYRTLLWPLTPLPFFLLFPHAPLFLPLPSPFPLSLPSPTSLPPPAPVSSHTLPYLPPSPLSPPSSHPSLLSPLPLLSPLTLPSLPLT